MRLLSPHCCLPLFPPLSIFLPSSSLGPRGGRAPLGAQDEKVRGEAGGGTNPPALAAVLGRKHRLVLGALPRVRLQLKRRNMASHTTVGTVEVDLEEVPLPAHEAFYPRHRILRKHTHT